MSEKYGIKAALSESQAESAVKLTSALVLIGECNSSEAVAEPHLISSLEDFEGVYTIASGTLSGALKDAAVWVFNHARLSECWCINVGSTNNYTKVNEAIDSIHAIYMDHGIVPNVVVLCASNRISSVNSVDHPAIHAAAVCGSIADHFKAQVIYDVYTDEDNVETINGKNRWKLSSVPTKESSHEACIACLGYGKNSASNSVWPLSVIAGCARVAQDAVNVGEVPSRSVGNLPIDSIDAYVCDTESEGEPVEIELTNNKSVNDTLAAAGFIILKNVGQKKHRIWGDHTAAVSGDGQVDDERARFDSYIAMAYHIANRCILKWQNIIDDPMSLSLRNDIINEEQDYLDYLVSIGALVGTPSCEFRPIDNTSDSLRSGQFYFTNIATYAVPAKYVEFKIVYTDAGLSAYLSEEA